MTLELLYKVGEEIQFSDILTSRIIEYIDVSNVHHLFTRYKKDHNLESVVAYIGLR